MEGIVSGVMGKGLASFLVEKPLSRTGNIPEENDDKQFVGNVKANSRSPLQSIVTTSEKGEFSTEKVADSQDKGFDQYF